jgi:hypothetical protein
MGIDSLTQQNMQNDGLTGIDRLASNAMFPQSQMDKTQYSVSSQLPTSAETLASDYDAPTNSYTGLATKPFAAGGIATLRYNGDEDGSQVQAWDPASGQVKLQQINPQDLSVAKTADYTIPKDDIQTFIPDTDTETGLSTGSGSYILNNGSKMRVDSTGTVIDATPARDEYTLNKDGYYQPTGSGLTWDGSAGMLTKKIGGIDVQVPGMFTKGGYQDEQGGLRLDQYGVPIPLPPAQYDSGAGKSGMSDAAPFIAMATLAAMGMPVEGMAFEGMVPASETLAGGFGTGATTSGGFGLNTVGTGGGIIPPSAGYTYGGVSAGALGTGVPASLMVPTTGALAGGAAAAGGFSAKQAYAAKMALDMLNSGAKSGGGGQSGSAPQVSAAPTIPTVNRFGVTGYEGQAPTTETIFRPISTSKIRGAPGEYTFAEGGMAMGGISTLGSYSDGGRLLKGPGDGMSDNIPAKIGDAQPARLADGEFVVPADVVSHLGNGSTDAGAKQLYAMMDKIRKARTGTKKQGKQINPSKFLL